MMRALYTCGAISAIFIAIAIVFFTFIDLETERTSYAQVSNNSDAPLSGVKLSWKKEYCLISQLATRAQLSCNLNGLSEGETLLILTYQHPLVGEVRKEHYVGGTGSEYFEFQVTKNGKVSSDWGLVTHNKSKHAEL